MVKIYSLHKETACSFFYVACVCVVYPYVLQPVRLVDKGVPVSFVYGRINDILHLPERLPHHMNVWDFQEVQLYIGVETLAFIPSILSLHVMEAAEARAEESKRKREISVLISDVRVSSDEEACLHSSVVKTLCVAPCW